MISPRPARALALATISSSLFAGALRGGEEPKDIGLIEQTRTRLVQIDVSIAGPDETIRDLGPEDFEVKVALRRVEEFRLDRLCADPGPAPPARGEAASETKPLEAGRAPASYVLYFDQPHLTMTGRHGAIDAARDLVPGLLGGGGRVMIVSNAADVAVVSPFSSDRQALLDALDRLRKDQKQWDPYTALEETRVEEVIKKIEDFGTQQAVGLAKTYAAEERWRAEKGLERLSNVLGAMADLDPPKAVLYFADAMRKNAGEHYVSMFPAQIRESLLVEGFAFERVIKEAAALGIRFYPVQAEGLVAVSSQRVRDAQASLAGLALETGGAAFLNGYRASKIAERIEADLSCMYIISFDPEGFPLDEPLPVKVEVRRPKVRVQARGRIVIQSESSRTTSRLLAAFAAPDSSSREVSIGSGVIPAGYAEGAFIALVQVKVGGSPASTATWDLGTSLVSRGKVREDASGRVTVSTPGTPVVFETRMSFAPGPYELVSVAYDVTTDQVASRRSEGSWPDPDEHPASVSPIAVVQRVPGAFLREGQGRASGSMTRGDDDPVRADQSTALVVLVCRGRKAKKVLRVERRVVGETEARFDPIELPPDADRCAPIVDVIREKTLTPGLFRYEVLVLEDGAEIARGERSFPAVQPGS